MFLEQALKIAFADDKPVRVLDLCAAPGGKSTHIVSLMPEGSLLVSNEVISARNKILQQNVTKWGSSRVIVTQNNAADFNRLPGYFDVVIVDAPCSGEGLFRKDREAVNEWSMNSVNKCSLRQTVILNDVISCLKKDGILIYSTCTFEESENDLQVQRLIKDAADAEFEKVNISNVAEGITITPFGYQFYPHRVKGEGFYLSMLRKKSGINYENAKLKSDRLPHNKFQPTNYLQNPAGNFTFQKNNDLYSIPVDLKSDFFILMKNLYIRQAGILLGNLVRDELIPSHQLAQCTDISINVPRISFNLDESLSYLRGETVVRHGLTRGWYVVEYEKNALGWIKVVGNRINNYYPKELKIVMRKK
jgi:NOL1/NOP2/fmu family ribosome biogenesis protein